MSLSWIHLLAFIAAICLLVTVHEFGHYWVARRLGFKVLRFSVGFGRPLWSRVAGADRTEYVIAAVPLGGYVKMLDEREGPVAPEDLHRAFTRRPHWQRITVLLAGPAFNILFAVLLLTGILLVSGINLVRPLLGDIEPNSIAGQAGLHAGDEIVSHQKSQRELAARRIAGPARRGQRQRSDHDVGTRERWGAARTPRCRYRIRPCATGSPSPPP
jgi:regulator of sigma E protease